MQVMLGTKVTDSITGLTGVAVSRTVYLNGCVRVGVQPQVVKDGKVADVEYADESQIVPVPAEDASMESAGFIPCLHRSDDGSQCCALGVHLSDVIAEVARLRYRASGTGGPAPAPRDMPAPRPDRPG